MPDQTITHIFRRSDLPEWARSDDDIYERAVNSLEFRCEVFDAKTHHAQSQLRVRNWRFMEEQRNL